MDQISVKSRFRTATRAGHVATPGHSTVPSGRSISPRVLSDTEAEASRREHGSNILHAKKRKSFARQFISNLGDPVIRILLGALVINLLFSFNGGGDIFETIGIALAVFLATLISTVSEYGSEAAFARLSEACGHTSCRVRRRTGGGETVCEISIDEVVVGDVVLLGAGEMIPADGVLISGGLQVDQSAMTGESREIEKVSAHAMPDTPSPADPSSLFRGCVILSGSGEMLVTRVGDATFLGEISGEVQIDTRESPLKLRLTKLAGQISRLGYVAAALISLIFLINAFLIDSAFDGSVIMMKLTNFSYVWQQLFRALTLGLTVLVVAVPEGLPMMIAVVLSSNIRKMVRDQVLVRKPVGIEAAGSMNILFTDKTGTLTEGRMSVGEIHLGGGESYANVGAFSSASPALFEHFSDACHTNTQSVPGRSSGDRTVHALGGNATDRALLDAALSVRSRQEKSDVLDHIPFDSTKKTSCARVRRGGQVILYVKGAPERLLSYVTAAYRPDGSRVPLDRTALRRRIERLTAEGGRVIMLAESTPCRPVPDRAQYERGEFGDLTLICYLVLGDSLRREAPEAVGKLRRAGIHVVMMTGDNRDTARAIAGRCGILGGGVDLVLESRELAAMTDGELRHILPRIGVIARALPTDKSRLVRVAQEADLVVGMTGDGINDAPALKRADVGFAMGAGTQVAKDAGDIIILDNNLASIAKAVLYGRTIFKSIRKFITLQLTMNLCAMGVTMICPFIGVDAPVTVVQMLWINLIMDTLGGLAFAGEAPLASYMEETPKRRDEPILNKYMVHQICFLGGTTVGLCILFLKLPFIAERFRPAEDHIYLLTAFFAFFIFSSVFNCFNARTDRLNPTAGLGRNRAFLLIMTAVLIIQIVFVYLGGAVLRTAPLTATELLLTSAMALLVFPIEGIRKVLWRVKGRKEGF